MTKPKMTLSKDMVKATSKYRNKKIVVDGIKFDSQKEARRYQELKLLEQSGVISGLRLQHPIILFEKSKYGRAIKYVADFTYIKDGKLVVEDVKSAFTRKNPVYRLKKRIVAEKYDIEIQEV